MDASADRPEFSPPPQPGLLRAFALAVLAHVLLVLFLMYGLRWQRETQDAGVEAELWSALPQEAAPKAEPAPPPPPPPPPPPQQEVVKAPPPPPPPVQREADIALEREKQKRELEKKKLAELERERELQKKKLEAQKKREQEELAKKKREQREQEELAKKKLEQQKLAAAEARKKEDDKKKKQQEQEARDAKRVAELREANMKRMQGMAGGTGAPTSTGTAERSSGPSASWAGRVQARVRPNIVFSDDVSGNPKAEVEVRLGPGGMILGKPRMVRSSGSPAWDEAVLRALERTESLPPDVDGRYPSPVIISFRPKG